MKLKMIYMRLSDLGWKAKFAIILIFISIILYSANFLIFQDANDLIFYIFIDLAFLPIEVLLVVLVIEAAITEREKVQKLEKLNMVIGVFFSEAGTDLINLFTIYDQNTPSMNFLIITDNWRSEDYRNAEQNLKKTKIQLNITNDEESIKFLLETKKYLIQNRNFLLALLENPNLLEHETFTDLLQAVFHLTEELDRRKEITNLSLADYHHLAGDINRVYNLLIYEWLQYMEHLMINYPYLYSLAMRMNPFDPEASIEIQDPS
jgi:hypothetical protein